MSAGLLNQAPGSGVEPHVEAYAEGQRAGGQGHRAQAEAHQRRAQEAPDLPAMERPEAPGLDQEGGKRPQGAPQGQKQPGEVFLAQPSTHMHLRLAFGGQTREAIHTSVELLGQMIRERLAQKNRSEDELYDWTPLV